jgi:hypothetical protein
MRAIWLDFLEDRMTRKIYDKLVRDRIPEIIRQSGSTCGTEIFEDDDPSIGGTIFTFSGFVSCAPYHPVSQPPYGLHTVLIKAVEIVPTGSWIPYIGTAYAAGLSSCWQ